MTLNNRQLDLRIAGCALALSARRIWEHTEFGQVNPFAPVPAADGIGDIQPDAYIDIVNMSGPVQMLAGFTLEDAIAGRQTGVVRVLVKQLLQHVGSETVRKWLADVQHHLVEFAQERAPCNIQQSFLVPDRASPFNMRGLHSSLKSWLNVQRTENASVAQWYQRIDNLTQEGLYADELAFCGLNDKLSEETDRIVSGDVMADCMHFDTLRLSILPAVRPAHAQLEFVRVPANANIKRIKPKLKPGFQLRPQWHDRVFGYWIDIVEWTELLGQMRGWMVSTHRGERVIANNNPSGLCASLEDAKLLANRHAEKLLPHFATQDGGAECRAWLVTLPYYAPSYFSSDFEHRNVLLHLRCDMREGPEGERVLLLQEVRSDWTQQARRDRKDGGASSMPIPVPPWLHDWPALALKLMLLHAAQCGAHALTWTTGDIQRKRDGGLGYEGVLALYGRTLPAEATRLLEPYGKKCERVESFQTANFFIEPTDAGYEVMDQLGEHLGVAASWEEAQAMLPDGAQEVPTPMHRVVLDDSLRRAILADGFYAWGTGVDVKV